LSEILAERGVQATWTSTFDFHSARSKNQVTFTSVVGSTVQPLLYRQPITDNTPAGIPFDRFEDLRIARGNGRANAATNTRSTTDKSTAEPPSQQPQQPQQPQEPMYPEQHLGVGYERLAAGETMRVPDDVVVGVGGHRLNSETMRTPTDVTPPVAWIRGFMNVSYLLPCPLVCLPG
jgi:hypothetical protein